MKLNYEIIATLGPASNTSLTWQAMISSGVTGFRLNTSHLSLPQLQDWLDKLEAFRSSLEVRPYLVLDLQGSKWRLGEFTTFELVPGSEVELIYAPSTDHQAVLPVPHQDFFKAVSISTGEIVLNDAKSRLMVEAVSPDSVKARVVQGGEISPRKGITFSSSTYRQEALSAKDQAILEQTRYFPSIRYAISYLRDSIEAMKYRELLGQTAYLIGKLERQPALDQAPEISLDMDELWLCRGDFGAELGLEEMAEKVYLFSNRIKALKVPVFMAGQVLEHMVDHPTPTRSEVSYIYNCLMSGYRGLVLSDETAIGRNTLESCRAAALFEHSR